MHQTDYRTSYILKKILYVIYLLLKYSGPCDLRPPIKPAKYGLKLKVVLN